MIFGWLLSSLKPKLNHGGMYRMNKRKLFISMNAWQAKLADFAVVLTAGMLLATGGMMTGIGHQQVKIAAQIETITEKLDVLTENMKMMEERVRSLEIKR